MKFAFLIITTLFSLNAQAGGKTITVDVYPYVASLGTQAQAVEQEIVDQAVKICGSIDKIGSLEEVHLTIAPTSATQGLINPKGTPGAPNFEAVVMFAYPRVQGSAKVFCK